MPEGITNLVQVVGYHQNSWEMAVNFRIMFEVGMPVGFTLYILGRVIRWATRSIWGAR